LPASIDVVGPEAIATFGGRIADQFAVRGALGCMVIVSPWVLRFFCPRAQRLERNEEGTMSRPEPDRGEEAPDILEVEARTHRRTALIELRGELDIATAPQVAEVLDGLAPATDGVRHVVLDLRGLTFMDARGVHELVRQNDYAHQNRRNLAVVRGRKAIDRLLALTAVEEILVLVDDPEDLAPPPSAPAD
jgi:anti-anti-sigma factor